MDRSTRRGASGGSLVDIDDEDFPPWLDELSLGVAVVLAICSVVGVPPAGRLPVSLLMAAALVPWVVRSVLGRHITALSGVTLAAVGLVSVGGWSWGWLEADAGSQMSLLLALWLVLCDAVVETLWPPLLETVALTGIVLASAAPTSWGSAIIWIPGIVLVFGGGRLLHSMAWTIVRIRAAEAQVARQAVAVEQRRIAREVHDVVAHSLSVTALQLTAARMAADRGDIDATRAALDDAERLTRASLGDLRGTVRLLREATAFDAGAGPDVGGHLPVPAALPGLDELSGLVASFRSAGMDVTVRQRPLRADPLVELAAYRVVQEALTNAARHQESPVAAVTVRADDGIVSVVVATTGRRTVGDDGGHGLVGMRERVEALGGHLLAGPTDEGWNVTATLPAGSTSPDQAGAGRTAPGPVPSCVRGHGGAPADAAPAEAASSGATPA